MLSTYDLGRQPVALARAAARLRAAGAQVEVVDLSLDPLDEAAVTAADVLVWSVPMHTATRLAVPLIARARTLNPAARHVAVGLYAVLNEAYLRRLGVGVCLPSEDDPGLLDLGPWAAGHRPLPAEAKRSRPLDRRGLPDLERYARLVAVDGTRRVVGAVEASHGCRHRCRHCPVAAVYRGRFRAVAVADVLADVARLADAGAAHISFADPDFLNGPAHARRVVDAFGARFGSLSFDVTAKIEHLARHREQLAGWARAGCVLITSAVESFDPAVLDRLDKRHRASDVETVVDACRQAGIGFNPTFVAFTPWTTVAGYVRFLDQIAALDLIASVAPVQYAIRLLITAGSALLDLPELAELAAPFDEDQLAHPWHHRDPAVDQLQRDVLALVRSAGTAPYAEDRFGLHRAVRALAVSSLGAAPGAAAAPAPAAAHRGAGPARQAATIAYLTEPWFC